MNQMDHTPMRRSRAIRPALVALLAAVVPAACWAWPERASAIEAIDVTVTRQGCQPGALTVPAGEAVFRIRNASARAMEWEILDGVMVKEERENIAPGFVQKLTAHLDAGTYAMTCGLLSNPKGSLVVTPVVNALPVRPSAMDLVGPVAAYKSYVEHETDDLIAHVRTLDEAVRAGDLAGARAAYAPAHMHYERIEPVAELFNDLDKSMDSRADDYEKKEADPTFRGFHRIEMALFRQGSTADIAPVADKLLADTLTLQQRLVDLVVPPGKMVGGSADLIEEVSATKITGEEDRYSRTDLWDFQANIDGSDKIFTLLRPLVHRADPALEREIAENFDKVDTVLARYRVQDGFKSYDMLTPDDRKALRGPVTLLAEDLAKLRGTLGLS